MCEVATGFRPAFLFSSGCPCANVERTPGATYMSATGKIGTLHRHPHAAPQALAPAALACMGVVFGDIGTSPLYTVSVTLKASSSGGIVAPEAVLGIVSLIFWSLIVVISIKYAVLIMRRQPRRGPHSGALPSTPVASTNSQSRAIASARSASTTQPISPRFTPQTMHTANNAP